MSFGSFPSIVAGDEALTRLVGRSASVLAVSEPARAMAIAGLVKATERAPLVVATPTTTEADRLIADLRVFLGHDPGP